jgi:hypothetical protein
MKTDSRAWSLMLFCLAALVAVMGQGLIPDVPTIKPISPWAWGSLSLFLFIWGLYVLCAKRRPAEPPRHREPRRNYVWSEPSD